MFRENLFSDIDVRAPSDLGKGGGGGGGGEADILLPGKKVVCVGRRIKSITKWIIKHALKKLYRNLLENKHTVSDPFLTLS